MKMSFRWYGSDDKVTLENIRQIPGMQAIVTAVYDVPVGEVWSRESIAGLKKQVEDAGEKRSGKWKKTLGRKAEKTESDDAKGGDEE